MDPLDPTQYDRARRSPRTLTLAALLVTGAVGGVAGVTTTKYLAPDWLSPRPASAFTLPEAQPMTGPATRPSPSSPPSPSAHSTTPANPVTPRPVVSKLPATAPSAPVNPFLSTDDLARRAKLRSILQTTRAQLALYQLQHGDRKPEFTKYAPWAQLTGRTRADGTPDPKGEFGPYLAAPPVNPVNDFGALGLLRLDPAPGQRTRGEHMGFVYVTSTGKIFATEHDGKTIWDESPSAEPPDAATRVHAQLSPQGKAAALNNELKSLRAQIELYKLQHADRAPDFARYASWEQMRRRTRADGAFDPQGIADAVLDHLPVNAVNNFSKVEVVGRVPANYHARGKEVGFIFETSTGRLVATDHAGAIWRE